MKFLNKFSVNTLKLFITFLILFKWSVSFSSCPYFIPDIKTSENYSYVIYIDPTANSGGDGSILAPLKAVPVTLQENTAYLIKRGTTLEQSITRVFTNVFLGAYGEGDMPVVKTIGEEVLKVERYSSNSTIRDIHFKASGSSPYGNSIGGIGDGREHRWQDTEYITVAFCRITGNTDGTGHYPRSGFGVSGKNIVVFNNEFAYNRENFTGIQGQDIFMVRNWWHNTAKGSEPPNDTGTGDGIISQEMYNDLFNVYFAGNLIDVSNKTDKYALMLNYSGDSDRMKNFVFEYNTLYSNKVGRGGTGLRWAAGQFAIGRKNLVSAIHPDGRQLVHNMSYWNYNAYYEEPYGVRDNHFIQTEGQSLIGEGGGNLEAHNLRFNSWADYNTYLNNNPEIGQYGSDINPVSFLKENDTFCGGGTTPETHHTLIINIQGNGTVVKNPDKEEYDHNEEVVLTAIEDAGSIFTGWAGVLGNTNPVTVIMNSNKTITASFEEIQDEPDPFVIQSATGAGIVSLPIPVTAGNLLVAVLAHRHDPKDQPDIPSGFTLREVIQHKSGNPDRHGILIADKIADGNETSFNLNFGTESDLGGTILEFDFQDVTFFGANSNTSGNNIPASFTENVPQPNAPHLSVSAVVSRNGEPLTDWNNEFISPLATRNQIGVASRFDDNLNKPDNVTVENTGDQGAIIVGSWAIGVGGGSGQTYQINTSTTGNGSITLNPNKLQYYENESVQLTAVADSGWEFVEWSGDLTGDTNPATVIMRSDKDISASFQLISYQIVAQANPENGGQISGTGVFSHGQNVTLTATTATGYTFTNWTENGNVVSNNASYTFTVTKNRNLTANFSTNAYTIGLSSNPPAGGTTSGGGNYGFSQSATVTASPASGYAFTNWTENGSVVSNNASYTFTVTKNRNLTANFSLNSFTLIYLAEENGFIEGKEIQYISYGENGEPVYATPNQGYHFVMWSDQSTNNPRQEINVNKNITRTALFEINVYTLSYESNENGSIMGATEQFVEHGENGSTVEAVPFLGYSFVAWSDGYKSNSRTDNNVFGDFQVFASFEPEEALEESNDKQEIEVYPIPTKSVLNVDVLLPEFFDVFIIDNGGVFITDLPVAKQGSNNYNVSWLSPGVYYLNLISSKNKFSKKFIKAR